MPKLLVIDGYDTEGMAFLARSGATRAGALYAQLLARFVDTDEIDIAEISLADNVIVAQENRLERVGHSRPDKLCHNLQLLLDHKRCT